LPISNIASDPKSKIIVTTGSSRLSSFTKKDKGKKDFCYIWSASQRKFLAKFQLDFWNTFCLNIACFSKNKREYKFVLVCGYDHLKRQVIGLYDISEFNFVEPKLVSKQISQFEVKSMKFISPRSFGEKQFVSCGTENIRLWTLKNKVMIASSLKMDNIARGVIFSDVYV
jgi:WD40 repeat protein